MVGNPLLAARLFDAVIDPAFGAVSDRTRTRLGRRRPWILVGALPLALSVVALRALYAVALAYPIDRGVHERIPAAIEERRRGRRRSSRAVQRPIPGCPLTGAGPSGRVGEAMIRSRMLGWLALLAWTFTQPALAGALALGFATHAHAHGIALRAEAGHVDLVFQHVAPHDHGSDPTVVAHDHSEAPPHGDHVLHLSSDEVSRDSGRRTTRPEPPAGLAIGPVFAPARPPVAAMRACARARTAPDLPRLTILRL